MERKMLKKITLTKGKNLHITRNVLVYDGTEKRLDVTLFHHRPSVWLSKQMVCSVLCEEKEYSHTEGDYVLEGEFCATEPGTYTAVIRGIRRYECEIPIEWEIFSRDDPRITENPYADYFLGKKNRFELMSVDYHPLNMDEIEVSPLPTYEMVIHYYEEKHKQEIPRMVNCSVFSMKSGFHEYQDSAYPRDSCSFELKKEDIARFAAGDGVTNSYRSKPYADLVTEQFCLSGAEFLRTKELPNIGERWKQFILRDAEETYPNNPLMLRKEKKLLQHKRASSTLAGLELNGNTEFAFITTIGDSVVFEIIVTEQKPRILYHTPPLSFREFTNRPEQLHSDDTSCPKEYIRTRKSTFDRGSIFLLATDALAQFILTPDEDFSSDKLTDLLAIKDNNAFEEYCSKQKAAGKLKEDDYTLIVVRIV